MSAQCQTLALSSRYIVTLNRSAQHHFQQAHSLVASCEAQGGKALWISDQVSLYPYRDDRSNPQRIPDLLLEMTHFTHLEIARILVELSAREVVDLILIEGAPRELERHYPRLTWICAYFNLRLIVLRD